MLDIWYVITKFCFPYELIIPVRKSDKYGLIPTFSYLKDDLGRKLFFTETLMLPDDRLERQELFYREIQIEVGSYQSTY